MVDEMSCWSMYKEFVVFVIAFKAFGFDIKQRTQGSQINGPEYRKSVRFELMRYLLLRATVFISTINVNFSKINSRNWLCIVLKVVHSYQQICQF